MIDNRDYHWRSNTQNWVAADEVATMAQPTAAMEPRTQSAPAFAWSAEMAQPETAAPADYAPQPPKGQGIIRPIAFAVGGAGAAAAVAIALMLGLGGSTPATAAPAPTSPPAVPAKAAPAPAAPAPMPAPESAMPAQSRQASTAYRQPAASASPSTPTEHSSHGYRSDDTSHTWTDNWQQQWHGQWTNLLPHFTSSEHGSNHHRSDSDDSGHGSTGHVEHSESNGDDSSYAQGGER